MFDCGSAATPELGAAKTITQIVFEQLQDNVCVRYGSHTKYLMTGTCRRDVAPVMAEMKSVVEDVLARLDADFHDQDVYMAFEALSLATWERYHAAGMEASRARIQGLLQKARRLWRALGMEEQWVARDFVKLVKSALRHRRAAFGVRTCAATPGSSGYPDNRMIWATFCAATPESQWALPVIQLYVSHPDGTGDVERGLGRHARFRDAHVGAPDADGTNGSSGPELCLEVRIDGPQDVSELFSTSDDGTLLLTDFSRKLATGWLNTYGRRYACQQKVRKDHGKRNTGWRLRGSMKAVTKLQRIAVDTLVEQADRDGDPARAKHRKTIIGTSHRSLMQEVMKQDCRGNR